MKDAKHCGNARCRGPACENWEKCRGETIPPWSSHRTPPKTGATLIREQDVLGAADALADCVLDLQAGACLKCIADKGRKSDCAECGINGAVLLASAYRRARNGAE